MIRTFDVQSEANGHDDLEESNSDADEESSSDETSHGDAVARFRSLSWYHEGMNRNTAEAVLLTNGVEGSYLLRDSTGNVGNFTVSVRCKDSVKHFSLEYDGDTYRFGIGEFSSMQELIEHFECLPVLGGETGPTVTLRYPYNSNVPEPQSYDLVARHAECGKHISRSLSNNEKYPDMHIASKEGYLVKRGAIHKNWKKRWFVLQKNELRYYPKRGAKKPIKVLDLKDLLEVCEDNSVGKSYCLRLVFPWRIFYAYTATLQEMQDWSEILSWKIEYYRQRKAPVRIEDPLSGVLRLSQTKKSIVGSDQYEHIDIFFKTFYGRYFHLLSTSLPRQ